MSFDATFTKRHEDASNFGVSVDGALKQSADLGKGVEAAKADTLAKLQTGKNDGGAPANSGGSFGMWKQVAAGVALSLVGGPLGAYGGAVAAINPSFLKSAVAAVNEPTSFKDYARSSKFGRGSKDEKNFEADRIANYEDAEKGVSQNGIYRAAPVSPVRQVSADPFAAPGPTGLDSIRDKYLRREFATLDRKSKDLEAQGVEAQAAAKRGGVATEYSFASVTKQMAGGPKPPGGGPGLIPGLSSLSGMI